MAVGADLDDWEEGRKDWRPNIARLLVGELYLQVTRS